MFVPPLAAALAIALSEQLPIGEPSFVKVKRQVCQDPDSFVLQHC
jgi:hypothetical protein